MFQLGGRELLAQFLQFEPTPLGMYILGFIKFGNWKQLLSCVTGDELRSYGYSILYYHLTSPIRFWCVPMKVTNLVSDFLGKKINNATRNGNV